MTRILTILSILLFSFLTEAKSSYVPNQIIVKFNLNNVQPTEIDLIHDAISAKADLERRGKLLKGMDLVILPDNISVEQGVEYYSSQSLKPFIEYAQPNYIGGEITGWPVTKPMSEKALLSTLSKSDDPALTYPTNDPMFKDQWALSNNNHTDINVLKAWEQSKGSNSIIVAVVDTGVDFLHKDLMDNIWINEDEIPGDGKDNDNNGYVDDVHGYNMINRNPNVMDRFGHGTHVSGTIGAITNNSLGVAGINWNVKIMALRAVPNQGDETDADIIESFMYAANNGARVINCSFGKYESGFAVQDTIDEIGKMGVLVAAAAGNSAENVDNDPSYPAAFNSTNLITVAATLDNDGLAWWSNFGQETIDIAAPGVFIVSTVKNNNYSFYDGTSMATPHVAGSAALLLSINPDLSAEEIKDLLMNSAKKHKHLEGFVKSSGRLDVGAAATALLESRLIP